MRHAHTPGPWHIGMKPGPIVYGPKGEQVANLSEPMLDIKENAANARLIASAPEMLEMLEASQEGLADEAARLREGVKPSPDRLEYLAERAAKVIHHAIGQQAGKE